MLERMLCVSFCRKGRIHANDRTFYFLPTGPRARRQFPHGYARRGVGLGVRRRAGHRAFARPVADRDGAFSCGKGRGVDLRAGKRRAFRNPFADRHPPAIPGGGTGGPPRRAFHRRHHAGRHDPRAQQPRARGRTAVHAGRAGTRGGNDCASQYAFFCTNF